MEQHRTRTPQNRQRRTAPLPPQGGPRRTAPVRRTAPAAPAAVAPGARTPRGPVPTLADRLRRLPNPRLTGLGGGLFCALAMFLIAYADSLVLGSSQTVYGFFFVPVAALTALWVRNADLVLAPVVVPIAFAVGVIPVADTDGGVGGLLMGLFTALALQAGWLYGGTLVAGIIVSVRKLRLMARRAAARRNAPPRPRGPRPPAQNGGRPARPTRPTRPTRA
ncbi:DUF6542 domain-containing protein [Streptomyces sp. NA04227]|uniref:DUF6542 domain-containing protein n=1 Tax=Streptomyces sp. NA04227 TaxID=2742136 RepID=UPI0020CA8FC1|nr:DUF6542 domain-containing protein [Streptomyces sp. NA04227]